VWGISRTHERKISMSRLTYVLHRIVAIGLSFPFRRTQRFSDHAMMKLVRIKRGILAVKASLGSNWKWLRH
jgi:hypothetical protein